MMTTSTVRISTSQSQLELVPAAWDSRSSVLVMPATTRPPFPALLHTLCESHSGRHEGSLSDLVATDQNAFGLNPIAAGVYSCEEVQPAWGYRLHLDQLFPVVKDAI